MPRIKTQKPGGRASWPGKFIELGSRNGKGSSFREIEIIPHNGHMQHNQNLG